jgi:diguanylate cyclase (GGDEF)-like protein
VRSLLVDRLELSLAAAGPAAGRLAVVSCDLDGLAALDHRYTPTIADSARGEVAGRLVATVRQGDLVARVGSQTFVLLCPGIGDPRDAAGIAQRVADAFDEPLQPAPDVTAHVRIAVGVALSGRDSTPASLLAAADQAMARVRADRLSAGRTD